MPFMGTGKRERKAEHGERERQRGRVEQARAALYRRVGFVRRVARARLAKLSGLARDRRAKLWRAVRRGRRAAAAPSLAQGRGGDGAASICPPSFGASRSAALDSEALLAVLEYLPDHRDRAAFGAVCVPWRGALAALELLRLKSGRRDSLDCGSSTASWDSFYTADGDGISLDTGAEFIAAEGGLPADNWADGNTERFKVRGPNYLADKRKVAVGPDASLLELVAVDLLTCAEGPIKHAAAHPDSFLERERKARGPFAPPPPWTFVLTYMNPPPSRSDDDLSIVQYFRLRASHPAAYCSCLEELLEVEHEGTPLGRLLRRWLDTPESELPRFKLIGALINAPWLVRAAIPQRPLVPGKFVRMPRYHGANYTEIGLEIGSNEFVGKVYRRLESAAARVVVEIAMLLEAREEDELPEQLLGVVRLARIDRSLALPVKLHPAGRAALSKSTSHRDAPPSS